MSAGALTQTATQEDGVERSLGSVAETPQSR
jgi:hypothetical protein